MDYYCLHLRIKLHNNVTNTAVMEACLSKLLHRQRSFIVIVHNEYDVVYSAHNSDERIRLYEDVSSSECDGCGPYGPCGPDSCSPFGSNGAYYDSDFGPFGPCSACNICGPYGKCQVCCNGQCDSSGSKSKLERVKLTKRKRRVRHNKPRKCRYNCMYIVLEGDADDDIIDNEDMIVTIKYKHIINITELYKLVTDAELYTDDLHKWSEIINKHINYISIPWSVSINKDVIKNGLVKDDDVVGFLNEISSLKVSLPNTTPSIAMKVSDIDKAALIHNNDMYINELKHLLSSGKVSEVFDELKSGNGTEYSSVGWYYQMLDDKDYKIISEFCDKISNYERLTGATIPLVMDNFITMYKNKLAGAVTDPYVRKNDLVVLCEALNY